jgi:hypothetical protein
MGSGVLAAGCTSSDSDRRPGDRRGGASGCVATLGCVRWKALALDYFLACLTMGVVFTPAIALLSLLGGTTAAIGFIAVVIAIAIATFWVAQRFDFPFPPWRERSGPDTPGKRRYPPA